MILPHLPIRVLVLTLQKLLNKDVSISYIYINYSIVAPTHIGTSSHQEDSDPKKVKLIFMPHKAHFTRQLPASDARSLAVLKPHYFEAHFFLIRDGWYKWP